jgi:hypothetical protein
MKDFGKVEPGSTIYIEFDSFSSAGASITLTGLAVTDVEVYKDGSTAQRASDSGYTLLDTDGIDFDGVTGIHGLSINLADNSTAGFWAAGSHYRVVISAVTIDSQTVTFTAATFRIGYEGAILNTTIATLASQTSFTLTSGPAEDDALNGCIVLIHDVASAVQKGFAVISDYTGATKTVTLTAGTTFTAATTDNVSLFPPVNAAYGGAVAYSAARGLAGTALPNAAADAAGGLPISDAGGLDLDNRMPASAAITNLNTVFNTDFASNYDATADRWKSSMTHINGTAITGTGSRIADSFVAMLNIASPVFTVGSVNQTGDSFARIGAAGASLTDLGGFSTTAKGQIQTEAEEALAAVGVTTARMGYVDNLNVGGAVASSAQVTGLNVNTRANLNVPIEIETPDASTQTYKIRLHLYDLLGNMEAPDSTPTVTLVNAAGTDRSSRLSAASNPSTGVYTWDYTATAGDAEEQLIWVFSVVEGGVTRTYPSTSYVVEFTAYRFDSSDRTKLNAIHAKLPSKTYITGTTNSDGDVQMDEATGNFPGSVGSINGVTFPTNFGALGINVSGHVSRVILVDTTTTNTDMITATGIRTAVGLASANLDTQLADLPTVAEFEARTIAAASYSTLTAAQVNTEADTALTDAGVTSARQAKLDEVTAARMGALTDWIDGGRLDLLLDSIVAAAVTEATEPGQGAPPVSASRMVKIDWLYKFLRNKADQTATEQRVYADNGTTVDHKRSVAEAAGTVTLGKIATGP